MAKSPHDFERLEAPIPSYLLRIVPRLETRRALHYELHDLSSGQVHRFSSMLGLRRFLASQAAEPGAAVPGQTLRRR